MDLDHIINRRNIRYADGGFPPVDKDLATVLGKVGPEGAKSNLIALAKAFNGNPGKALRIESSKLATDPFPLACWFALQMAVSRKVLLITVGGLIQARFSGVGITPIAAKSLDVGMVIRLGHDTPHRWNEPTLMEVVSSRIAHRLPTVLCYSRELHHDVYGCAAAEMALLSLNPWGK